MSLLQDKENLNKEQNDIKNKIKESLNSFIEKNNETTSNYSIKIEAFEKDDLRLTISNGDLEIKFRINKFECKDEEISLALNIPSLYTWNSDFFEKESFNETEKHIQNSNNLFVFAKSIKDNIKELRPQLKHIFDLKNDLDNKNLEIKENSENITQDIEALFLNDIVKDFNLASEAEAKEIFDKIDFYYGSTINIIHVQTYTDKKNAVFVRFEKTILDIENVARLSCKYDGQRISKKDIQNKIEGGLIINGELDQNFDSLQQKLAIPRPASIKKRLNISYDDYYELLDQQNNKNDVLEFIENKKNKVLNKILDSNNSDFKKKKIGLYGFK